ncbi:MAG: site-specific integrase, partial [Haliscomenobacter sp.]
MAAPDTLVLWPYWKPLLHGFEAYLLLERGLSENTREAYLRDIRKLAEFTRLSDTAPSLAQLDTEVLRRFLIFLNELGLG